LTEGVSLAQECTLSRETASEMAQKLEN